MTGRARQRWRIALVMPCLLMLARPGRAQLPERTRTAPTVSPADQPVAPPLPVTDPRLEPQPAVVQPGTILREPPLLRTREIVYLPLGESPGNLQVTAMGPRSVALSWAAPAGAAGYWIHHAGPGQSTFYRGGSLVTGTTTTVNQLLPATAYQFKVSAVYPQELQRREGMSEAVSVTTSPAPAPPGLAASATGGGRVSLSWDQLSGADGFRLSRNGATVGEIRPFSSSAGAPATLRTSFADSVGPGTHGYQIQAVYRVEGAEAVSAPAPAPPVSVTIQAGSRVRYCQTAARTSGGTSP